MSPASTPSEYPPPDIPGSYYDRIMEARYHLDRGEWEAADAIYQRLVDRLSRLPERRRPAGSDLNTFLVAATAGAIHTRAHFGDFAAAERLCQQLQHLDAEKADEWLLYYFAVRIAAGQVDEGLADLRQRAEAEPDKFVLWIGLATEAIDARRYELAEEAIDRAELLAPIATAERARLRVHLARYDLYQAQRRWKEAGAEWDRAYEIDPVLVGASQEGVLRMFLAAGLLDDARRYLGGALDEPLTHFYDACLAYRRGDTVRARALWRKVVQTEPQEDRQWLNAQAMAWCYLGEPVEALKLLLDAVSSDRSVRARSAIVLALAWAMDGNLDAAKVDLGIATTIICETPEEKLPAPDWYDFDQLVQDQAIKSALRPYFEA